MTEPVSSPARDPTQRLRFEALDGWRGVAALSVALVHLSAAGYFYTLWWVRQAGVFVDLFFVLSGFVISYTYLDHLSDRNDMQDFIIRRFGRIWPLHVVTLSFVLLLELVKLFLLRHQPLTSGEAPFTGHTSPYALLSNLLLLQAFGLHSTYTWNGPSWSLSAEFWTYLVFGLLARYLPRHLVGIAWSLMIASLAILYQSDSGEWYRWGFFGCLLNFFAGVLIFKLYRKAPRLLSSPSWEWVAFAAILALTAVAEMKHMRLLAPVVFGFGVLVFAHESGPFSKFLLTRPLQRLGQYSYSIYLVHFPLLSILNATLRVLQQKTGWELRETIDFDGPPVDMIVIGQHIFWNDLLALGYLAVVCWVASRTYRYIEDPARRFFAALARRRRPQLAAPAPA